MQKQKLYISAIKVFSTHEHECLENIIDLALNNHTPD